MTDKPSREAERVALDDPHADTGNDSISDPTIPIADKGETARVRQDDADPADGLSTTPRPRSDRAEQLAVTDGLMDPQPELQPLDFDDGSMSTDEITQGESVIEAAYGDRGPATHLDPDAGDRLDRMSAAEVLEAVVGEPASAYRDEEET